MRILGFEINKAENRQIANLENELRQMQNVFYGRQDQYIPSYKASKTNITEASALTLSAVWASVRLISNSIATMPTNAHFRDSDGNSTIATDSYYQKVIKNPNAIMTTFIYKFTLLACKLLHGNGYAAIERDSNGNPTQLIPIHPNRVEVLVVNGYVKYKIDGDDKNLIDAENMIHIKGITTDGLKGISTIKAQAINIGLDISASEQYGSFLGKGSKVEGIMTYPNKFDGPAKQKAEEAVSKKFSGQETPSGTKITVPIFDNGAKFVQIGVNPAEAMWLDFMGYGTEDIARIFGVPPHKIASLKQSTNNNIEQQSMDYVNDCLLPLAKEFEEEHDRKLSTGEEFMKTNFNGLLRGDSQGRAALYNSLFQNGGITPNQICRLEDLPTFEGGDEHYTQLNMIPVSKQDEYYAMQNQNKTTAKRTEIEDILDIIEKRNLIK